jgi:hypothetical protein
LGSGLVRVRCGAIVRVVVRAVSERHHSGMPHYEISLRNTIRARS